MGVLLADRIVTLTYSEALDMDPDELRALHVSCGTARGGVYDERRGEWLDPKTAKSAKRSVRRR